MLFLSERILFIAGCVGDDERLGERIIGCMPIFGSNSPCLLFIWYIVYYVVYIDIYLLSYVCPLWNSGILLAVSRSEI
jgi:hypothetical protein